MAFITASVYYEKRTKLINTIRKGRGKFYIFDSGEILSTKDIKDKLYFKCEECGNFKQQNIYHGILDKHYLCQSCNKRGENNPFYGKTHTEELKRKRSEERKGSWCIGENNGMYNKSFYERWVELYGETEAKRLLSEHSEKMSYSCKGSKNGFYGKSHDPKTVNANAKKHKQWWASMSDEELEKYKNKVSLAQTSFKDANPDYYTDIKRKAGYASVKSQKSYKINNIERIILEELEERKLDFKFSVILGYNQYDFGCKQHKILIEVQGDYWHGNPNMYGDTKKPLNDTQMKKMKRDEIKRDFAMKHNLTLFYIWEEEINNGSYIERINEIEQYIISLI